ncbi:hypothetical protein IFM89_029575 [Coptis chinensis]|uniref:Uncharacterized protein n=1 Tax=Coptis chinensis TaxID=261450 RepID=A0A835LFI2_9MAGN|nr:hypothetical protein IFM89_029575 [Coptis chinensis]
MDGATSMKRRLDFAKVCVTIPLDFEFPSSIKPRYVAKLCSLAWKLVRSETRTLWLRLGLRSNSQNVATPSFGDLAGPDVLAMINVAVDNRESPSSARTSARHQHDLQQPPSPLLDAVVSRDSPSTANTVAAATSGPNLQVDINRLYPEVDNGLVVTRVSPSSDRMSARSPTSLGRPVVSRESPSTAMTTVGTPSSTSFLRPSQSLTRYNKANAGSLGPLLATPSLPRLISSATEGSTLNKQNGSSSFPLGISGSPTSSRDCGNPRGKEVVVYSSHKQSQADLELEVGSVSAEELFQFNVDNNAYAALVMEEEGIDDDISETNEEPFDDHIEISPQVISLNMPSQVVTRGQLQQQQLQKSENRGRGRAKSSGNRGKNKR